MNEHNATKRARERRERIRETEARNHAAGLHHPPVQGCADCARRDEATSEPAVWTGKTTSPPHLQGSIYSGDEATSEEKEP
jgi:hypothetical protein